jgi:hypothetical protein
MRQESLDSMNTGVRCLISQIGLKRPVVPFKWWP